MTKIIEVIVAPDGSTKIETKGFTGASCRDPSQFIEQALGQRVGARLTAEFHRGELAQRNQTQQGT